MRFVTFFALVLPPVYASQGVALLPSETLNFGIPNQIPFSSQPSSRVEIRLHSYSQPQDIASVVNVPGLQLRLTGAAYGCTVMITDWLDTFAPGVGNGLCLNYAGKNDMIIRMQRDATANILSAQIWSADGSGQPVTASLSFTAPGILQLPATGVIGDTQTNGVLDYFRWFSTISTPGANPFAPSQGDLADCEFEGSLADGSGQNLVLTPNVAVTYAGSPGYAPLASQGAQRVFRAGQATLLYGSGSVALNGNAA